MYFSIFSTLTYVQPHQWKALAETFLMRAALKINQYLHYPRLSFTPKTDIVFPKTAVLRKAHRDLLNFSAELERICGTPLSTSYFMLIGFTISQKSSILWREWEA